MATVIDDPNALVVRNEFNPNRRTSAHRRQILTKIVKLLQRVSRHDAKTKRKNTVMCKRRKRHQDGRHGAQTRNEGYAL